MSVQPASEIHRPSTRDIAWLGGLGSIELGDIELGDDGGDGLILPPSAVPGRILALESELGIGLTGPDVTSWLSQETATHHDYVSAGAPPELITTGPIDKVRFVAASSERLIGDSIVAMFQNTAFTVYIVGAIRSGLIWGTNSTTERFSVGRVEANYTNADQLPYAGTSNVAVYRHSHDGTTHKISRDGVQLGTSAVALFTFAAAVTMLGRGGATYSDGDLYAVDAWTRDLTDSESAGVEAFYAQKYAGIIGAP
jgi:hypothetical protein